MKDSPKKDTLKEDMIAKDTQKEIYNAAVKSCIEQEELWDIKTDYVAGNGSFCFQSNSPRSFVKQIYIHDTDFRVRVVVWLGSGKCMAFCGSFFSKEYWALKRIYKRRRLLEERKEYHNMLKDAHDIVMAVSKKPVSELEGDK